MNRNHNEKLPVNWGSILIRAAAVLFCLLMLSVYLLSGLFARYVSADQSGDSARVAAFDVNVTPVANHVDIEYGVSLNDEGAFQILVVNNSEVDVTYDVQVEVEKADDSFDIRVALEGQELDTSTDTTMLFEKVGYLSGSEQNTHDLVFTVLEWGDFTKNEAGTPARTETLNFRVLVDVVQVD